ncbi:transcription factor bHLH94 [Impatiens glandulifera]|uniref:transcription factor bHLH94 n=1 Tax=Impatiens glandulifera TaxID=253017 RepID=UPI001FB10CFB|nr:transcription factor bHLH94 [Impatiens glandulifera]
MALDTAVFPQDQFAYGCNKEFFTLVGGAGGWGFDELGFQDELENKPLIESIDSELGSHVANNGNGNENGNWNNSSIEFWVPNSLSPEICKSDAHHLFDEMSTLRSTPVTPAGRRKRRRTKSCKNKEELENQRMTHIAVERNRRKQMNEYLAVIRTLMPASYVQRGDQASIIGGAINYVKELEQLLQTLEAQKSVSPPPPPPQSQTHIGAGTGAGSSPIFSDFFTFPQYSTRSAQVSSSSPASLDTMATTERQVPAAAAMGEIEVSMAESHANIKVLSNRRPRQLVKMVAGLQCLRLTVLHLNVTTVDQTALYSLSVKLEEGCQLTTVDEIADAMNNLLARIEEETAINL